MKAKIFYGSFKSLTNQINKSGANLRVDCHFNSFSDPEANYSWAKYRTGDHSSNMIAGTLCRATGNNLGIHSKSVASLSPGQRGYPIVRDMNCPTVLWEPCFCSNPAGADVVKNQRNLLHDAFLETINVLSRDALIALVPGHAHKRTGDTGAGVYGGGTEGYYTELLCQELFSLINSQPVQDEEEEDMEVQYGKANRHLVAVDNSRGPWLNLGNDEPVRASVTVWICFVKTNENINLTEDKPIELEAYSAMQPGIDLRSKIREKLPNFSGAVMVTVKADTPIVSGIDTPRG